MQLNELCTHFYQKSRKICCSSMCIPSSNTQPCSALVPCPPGSHKDDIKGACVPCDVGMYQDNSGQSSCKKCPLENTSTTSGAEGCFFNHGMFLSLNGCNLCHQKNNLHNLFWFISRIK